MARDGLLDTEVPYVSVEGDAVMASLGCLDGDRVLHGMPVRRFPLFAGPRLLHEPTRHCGC